MCMTCGCSDDAEPMVRAVETEQTIDLEENGNHGHYHEHHHDHDDPHPNRHTRATGDLARGAVAPAEVSANRTIRLEQELLAKNARAAERNLGWFAGRRVTALNLMSSPGAGKTTLLERTIRALGREIPVSVIEADQATVTDAQRIRATGCRVVQINTGTGCHLDAEMLGRGLEQLDPPMNSTVMIENVGNLVCPALFDLGERAKIVLLAVTDGEDKPIKYPHIFRASDVMILNKIDLLPHVTFDVGRCLDYARQVNPHLTVFQVSATRGDGVEDWYAWVRRQSVQSTAVRSR